jgi:hypothetical protein
MTQTQDAARLQHSREDARIGIETVVEEEGGSTGGGLRAQHEYGCTRAAGADNRRRVECGKDACVEEWRLGGREET